MSKFHTNTFNCIQPIHHMRSCGRQLRLICSCLNKWYSKKNYDGLLYVHRVLKKPFFLMVNKQNLAPYFNCLHDADNHIMSIYDTHTHFNLKSNLHLNSSSLFFTAAAAADASQFFDWWCPIVILMLKRLHTDSQSHTFFWCVCKLRKREELSIFFSPLPLRAFIFYLFSSGQFYMYEYMYFTIWNIFYFILFLRWKSWENCL
jgi:hypothetical protein